MLTATAAYKCPAAPYEAAMLIADALRRRGVRQAVQIDLYAAEPGPMGVTGPQVSAAVRQVVESKGITYHPEHQVVSVDPSARRLVFANGTNADFDLLVYVPLTMGKPLPKAGVFAHAQAEVVSANITNAWTGQGRRRLFDGNGQCFLETGDGSAGLGEGNFYGEPTPQVKLRRASRWWHWAKVVFEKRWLYQWL